MEQTTKLGKHFFSCSYVSYLCLEDSFWFSSCQCTVDLHNGALCNWPFCGVEYRGMGGAGLIKALFSPGIVLYRCLIWTEQTNNNDNKKITSLRSSTVMNGRVKSPLTCQHVFISNNLTVSVKMGKKNRHEN